MQLLEKKDKAVENIEINLMKYPTGSKVTYELTVKRALLLSVWKLGLVIEENVYTIPYVAVRT
jgi:hypothetical protein